MSAGLFNKTAVESGWFDSTASEAGWFDPDLLEESNQPSDPAFIPAIGLFGGSSAVTSANYSLTSTSASLSLTASTANLTKIRKLTSTEASLSLTASTANLTKLRKLVSTPSVLTLTASTANLVKTRKLVSTASGLTLTGATGQLTKIKLVGGVAGALSLTGSTATLNYTTGSGTNYPLTCSPGALTLAGGASALVGILDQVRVFDTRYIGNNWIYEYAVYPPGWPGYYIVAVNGGVSDVSNLGRGVSDISHQVIDNMDGTITLNEQVTVSKDKQDAVSHVNYEVILS